MCAAAVGMLVASLYACLVALAIRASRDFISAFVYGTILSAYVILGLIVLSIIRVL